jgi:hypothetical protein
VVSGRRQAISRNFRVLNLYLKPETQNNELTVYRLPFTARRLPAFADNKKNNLIAYLTVTW